MYINVCLNRLQIFKNNSNRTKKLSSARNLSIRYGFLRLFPDVPIKKAMHIYNNTFKSFHSNCNEIHQESKYIYIGENILNLLLMV